MNAKVLDAAFYPRTAVSNRVLLGQSPAAAELRRLVTRAGPKDVGVLITGESGTGKEFVARLIHARSPRAQGPFVRLNCDALPPDVIETELFGSEARDAAGVRQVHAGALERAAGGTLLLEEIAALPLPIQGRLLSVMETGRFYRTGGGNAIRIDVRIMGSSCRCPLDMTRQGLLREDILYRLAVFLVQVPALRERGTDVVALADHFLAELNAQESRRKHFSARSRELLVRHDWPGNVRELRNCIERAFILCDEQLELSPLIDLMSVAGNGGSLQIRVGSSIDQAERSLIEATLQHYKGNKRRAADTLGCSLKTLYNKLHAYERTEAHVSIG